MATLTKVILSGSSGGRPVQVSATSGQVVIHTPHTSTTTIDEVWVYGVNNGTATVDGFLLWGGTATEAQIAFSLSPKEGAVNIIEGLPILGNSAGSSVIGALVSGTNSILLHGFVHRIEE